MTRRLRALGSAALLTAIAGGWALWPGGASGHYPPGPTRPCGTDAVLNKGQWSTIKAPPRMDQITTHAAGGPDGKLLLASNGRRVMRSADGGCTWDPAPVYTVPTGDSDTGGALPTIAEVVFPGGDWSRAFLLVDGVGRAAAPQVLASTDGGRTWRASSAGLPASGRLRDLAGAGDRLYLNIASSDTAADSDPAGLTGALYRSTDGGASWSRQSSGVQIERLAADPVQRDTVWVVRANHTVERSGDGGATFSAVALSKDPDDHPDVPTAPKFSNWREVAIARRDASGPATVVVGASENRDSDVTRLVASENGGQTFKDLPVGGIGPLEGISFGNSPRQILIVSGSDSTAFHGPALHAFDLDFGAWRDVDELSLVSLRESRSIALSAASRGHAGLTALEFRRHAPGEAPPPPDVIARYIPPDPPPGNPSLFDRVRCGGAAKPAPPQEPKPPVTFEPDALSVRLDPGKPLRVDLKAELRAVPTPLDAYFLIDSSNSMDPAIDGVKCSIERLARDLTERGVDARFGVGTYTDRYARRYLRLRDLGPYGPDLVSAIDGLLTQRGVEEPIRSALYQTATGAGLDFGDVQDGQPVPVHIDKDTGASYRPGALHTAFVVGNEPFDETTPGEPSRDQVVQALKAKNVLSIGVQVVSPFLKGTAPPSYETDPSQGPAPQLLFNQQLRFFAQSTGALAPKGGVDCDGGGSPDLREGDPLVCQVDDRGVRETMGDTLMTLLTQFRETADVKLVPKETSGLSVSVEGGEAKAVDVKRPSELAATAVLACTAEQIGHAFALSFAVMVGGREVGTLPATARCGRLIAPVVPSRRPRREGPPATTPSPSPAKAPSAAPNPAPPAIPAPAPPHPAAVVSPAPPPPSPAPVTPSAAVAPSAASAPASASAPAAGAAPAPAPGAVAAAPQRRADPQVAVVRTSGEHAMTAYKRELVPAPALITFGLGACAAFGFFGWSAALRRRPRVALQRVPVRRRPRGRG